MMTAEAWAQSLITAALTTLLSFGVYVVGQLFSKYVLDPIVDLKKAISEVRFALSMYAPVIHTPLARHAPNSTPRQNSSEDARDALMKCSANLIVGLGALPNCMCLSLWKGSLPELADIEDAAINLRGLSTYVHDTGDNAVQQLEVVRKIVARIERKLKLHRIKRDETDD